MTVVLKDGIRVALLAVVCLAGPGLAQAQIFGDDEARRAILDLRQRFDQSVTAQNRLVEENTQLRRSMLQLQSDMASLREDLARTRGEQERLEHDFAGLKAQLTQATDALRDSNAPLEGEGAQPGDATGAAAGADADEKQEFDAALAKFQSGDFRGSQGAFGDFVKRHPTSPLAPDALFWLGNAQYATRNYREAIANFRSVLSAAPNSPRAPDAMLSIASSQTEMRDVPAARATLESLVKRYPQSEAAQAARDRLAKLK